ncbi:hypothetical protein WR25_22137 [Diploscapter pachys]|uniref:Uncharacterized protein n=1 Tax=Diploscapter pachys TaxID=2018661 RepID=A0A2A2KXI6_9BILA|nr:hypothetical protein WR25_22137 [Diploscapter pachys]
MGSKLESNQVQAERAKAAKKQAEAAEKRAREEKQRLAKEERERLAKAAEAKRANGDRERRDREAEKRVQAERAKAAEKRVEAAEKRAREEKQRLAREGRERLAKMAEAKRANDDRERRDREAEKRVQAERDRRIKAAEKRAREERERQNMEEWAAKRRAEEKNKLGVEQERNARRQTHEAGNVSQPVERSRTNLSVGESRRPVDFVAIGLKHERFIEEIKEEFAALQLKPKNTKKKSVFRRLGEKFGLMTDPEVKARQKFIREKLEAGRRVVAEERNAHHQSSLSSQEQASQLTHLPQQMSFQSPQIATISGTSESGHECSSVDDIELPRGYSSGSGSSRGRGKKVDRTQRSTQRSFLPTNKSSASGSNSTLELPRRNPKRRVREESGNTSKRFHTSQSDVDYSIDDSIDNTSSNLDRSVVDPSAPVFEALKSHDPNVTLGDEPFKPPKLTFSIITSNHSIPDANVFEGHQAEMDSSSTSALSANLPNLPDSHDQVS